MMTTEPCTETQKAEWRAIGDAMDVVKERAESLERDVLSLMRLVVEDGPHTEWHLEQAKQATRDLIAARAEWLALLETRKALPYDAELAVLRAARS